MRKNVLCTVSLFFLLSNGLVSTLDARVKNKQPKQAKTKSSKGLLASFELPSFMNSPFNKTSETVSYQKDVPPHVGISIDNTITDGDITVKTWKNPSVLIEATKKGKADTVGNTQIAIHKDKNELTITTVTSEKAAACNIDYTLLVPEGCTLESVATKTGKITIYNIQNKIVARSNHGRIEMNNVSGTIETSNKKGEIVINTNTILPESKIFAFSEQGKISLSVPKKTNAVLTAETKKGKIASTVAITTSPRTMKFNSKTLAELGQKTEGTLGKGGSASIKLLARSGITVNEV